MEYGPQLDQVAVAAVVAVVIVVLHDHFKNVFYSMQPVATD